LHIPAPRPGLEPGTCGRFPFQSPIDQAGYNHAGQVAFIPYKWNQDNVEAFRRIYGTGDLGGNVAIQGELATMRVVTKHDRTGDRAIANICGHFPLHVPPSHPDMPTSAAPVRQQRKRFGLASGRPGWPT
jgi:hypothetical protein